MNNNNSQQLVPIKPKLKINKKRLIVVIIVGLLLVGGVVGGFVYVSMQKSASEKNAAQEAERKQTASNTAEKAQNLSDNGDSAEAITMLDDAIKATDNIQTKSFLSTTKATIYYNNADYDKALTAAIESESYDKNDNIEKLIALIYEKKGDNQNAIKYYKIAISLVDKTKPMASDDIKEYQTQIDILGEANK